MTRKLFKVLIYNFLGFKNMKKGYIKMTKKIYLETCVLIALFSTTIIQLFGYELFKISYHMAEFDGEKHCGSGYIIVLTCQVIS